MGNISARGSNHDPLLANPDINLRSGLSATDCGTLPGVTGNGMLMARQREVSVPHSLSLFMLILELPGMGVITGGVPAWDIAKPLVDEATGQDPHPLPRGFSCFLPCRAAVVCPDLHLRCRGHPAPPQEDRSAWRKLSPGRQALLVLAYLRRGDTFAELAAGFGIGTATT